MSEKRDEYLSRKTGTVRKRRSDGWTRRDIDAFLGHLRITGNVSSSAAAIGKSERSAENLRAVDPEFDAQVIAARAEMRARMESKIALFAETGGKLPPLGADGVPAEPPLEDFDPQLAMAWLKFLESKGQMRGRRGGPRPKSVSKDALVQALLMLFDMVERRLAKRAAA
jgi:hypothetical protein